MKNKKRKLKVYATGARYVNRRWKPYPEVRIQGDYLDAAGFKIGVQYSADVRNGEIVLRVIDQDQTEDMA